MRFKEGNNIGHFHDGKISIDFIGSLKAPCDIVIFRITMYAIDTSFNTGLLLKIFF